LISFLADNGADVNFITIHGRRALDLAAFDGQVAYTEHLIDLGADVNPLNAEYLPLIEAARNGHLEAVRVLLAPGADINAKTPRGTAIHATFWGREDAEEKKERYGRINTNDILKFKEIEDLLRQKGAVGPSEGGQLGWLDMFAKDIANNAVDGTVSKTSQT